MPNRDAFSACHPMINFLYFALVLVYSMFFMHPVCLVISLVAAILYGTYLNGKKATRFNLRYMLPIMILTALINPVFNHEGATILTYLPTDNPLTLESIVYGVAAAAMLAAVISWFSCYSAVMTSDKFVYLFGRVIPALSLVLSMTLRFIPKFKKQFEVVSEAQRCVGRDVSNGSLMQRMRNAITIFSILITWSLENAIETADSMKSRGYGLPGRSAFSIYRFDKRDKDLLTWLCVLGGYVFVVWLAGGFENRYFPTFQIAALSPWSVTGMVAFALLCLTPVLLDVQEDRTWARLQRREVPPCTKA